MVTSFKQYLVEEEREVVFTFGRMNPPTIGHGKLMNAMSAKAGNKPYRIFLSKSQDPAKNPLTYEQKIKHVRKMFPKHARNVILNKKINNIFTAADLLYNQGFNKVTLVVGADRVLEFETLLKKYNGMQRKDGFYNFEKITVASAGERDPDAEGVEGMSASKQRANAKNNDFVTFSQGVPSTMNDKDAKKLFNDIRAGMGLAESRKFKNHIELGPKSLVREKYVVGDLFNEGDKVTIKSTGQTGFIHRLGSNHVIVALDEGKISRQWLENVKKVKTSFVKEEVTQAQIRDLETFADRLLAKFDVDIEFTRHFADRVNDARNRPAITVAELQGIFKKIERNKAEKIKRYPNSEVVLKDLQSDLNLPIVINFNKNKNEFEVVNKTIMRKKNFQTSNSVLRLESTSWRSTGHYTKDGTEWKGDQHAHNGQIMTGKTHTKDSENLYHFKDLPANIQRKILDKLNIKDVEVKEADETEIDKAKRQVGLEKMRDERKYDRILDRARLIHTRKLNASKK